ncbi:MAG: Heme chaperone HemW [Desulfovibrio sp.]
MLLYIHVPFCRAKCRYCAFYSEPLGGAGADAVQAYSDTLLSEIALWGDRLGKTEVTSIFFGGGTPSLLPPKALGTILNRIRKAFAVTPDAEISMEANPESFLAFGYAYEVAALGVNRVSLGVQSLNEDLLKALGRPHTKREAIGAYEAARAAGIPSVNLDLIWGLPGQKRREWLRELAEIVTMQPDHLSCYGLTLEEGTPLAVEYNEGRLELPEEKIQASMYVDGADYLETAGLLQYEISNFARMGFQCRHNIGYWESEDYIGLGPAATSTLKGLRWTNPADIPAWRNLVAKGTLAYDAEKLTPKTRLLETVMLRLRTTRGLRLKAYRDLTGRDFMKDNKTLMHGLHKEGLVRFRNGYVRLTRSGMLVSNSILGHLFDTMECQLDK